MSAHKTPSAVAVLFGHDERASKENFRLLSRRSMLSKIEPLIQAMTLADADNLNKALQDVHPQIQASVDHVAQAEKWELKEDSQARVNTLANALRVWSKEPEEGLPWYFADGAQALCRPALTSVTHALLPKDSTSGLSCRVAHVVEGALLVQDIAQLAEHAPSGRKFAKLTSIKRGSRVTSEHFASEENEGQLSSFKQQAENLRGAVNKIDNILTEVAERDGKSRPLGVLELSSHIAKLTVYATQPTAPQPQSLSPSTPKAGLV